MKKLAEIAIKYFFMMTLCSVDYRLNFSLRRGEIWLFLAPYPNPGFSGWEKKYLLALRRFCAGKV